MRSLAPLALFVVAACATIGSEGQGDLNLPSSGVGPFRKLGADEVLGVAPFVLDKPAADYREPSALALDVDPASTRVALYVTLTEKDPSGTHDAIGRTRSDDARTFYGTTGDSGHTPQVVLRADAAWEGAGVRSPSALQVGGRVYLYYAGDDGVGLATSDDGLAFQKAGDAVLTANGAASWETEPPRAPSVAVFPDGRFHMLYASGVQIGEATSDDGKAWTRVGDPILGVSDPVDPATLTIGEKQPFDTYSVGDPLLLPRTTPGGRTQVRVLYTGFDFAPGTTGRQSTIGFAARYGDFGPLVKQALAVYSVSKQEAAPALFAWSGGTMLYVHQNETGPPPYPAIAAAFAPATGTLPKPGVFPDGP